MEWSRLGRRGVVEEVSGVVGTPLSGAERRESTEGKIWCPRYAPPAWSARPRCELAAVTSVSRQQQADSRYEGNPCNGHILGLGQRIKKSLVKAGIVGYQFGTVGVSDGISMGTAGSEYPYQRERERKPVYGC
jgi:hypothetical protein